MKLEEQIKRIKQMMLTEEHHDVKGRGGNESGGTSASSSGSYISAGSFEAGGILHNNGRKDDIGELPNEVDITGGDSEEITVSIDDVFGQDPSIDVIDVIDNLVGVADPIGPGGPRGGGEGPGDPRGGGDGGPGDPGPGDPGPGDPASGGHGGGHGGDYDDDDYGGDYDDDEWGHPTERVEDKPARDSMDFVPCCEPCGDGMWKRCNTDDCIYSTISDCELRGNNKTYNESTEPRSTFND